MPIKSSLVFAALLMSCSSGNAPWVIDSIIAGDKSFNSTRLVYKNPLSCSPLKLEWIRSGEETFCFLSLSRFRFHPLPTDPPTVKVEFHIEGEVFEESIPLSEGGMRLRLSPSRAESLISFLQEGKKVAILVDGFEETFHPENFQKMVDKWKGSPFRNPLRDPLE